MYISSLHKGGGLRPPPQRGAAGLRPAAPLCGILYGWVCGCGGGAGEAADAAKTCINICFSVINRHKPHSGPPGLAFFSTKTRRATRA